MDDPWQLLGLDRNTATERDVKAAYARLLKQHRPDKDPAGFQKLRAAYEAALEEIAWRDAPPEIQPADLPTPAEEEIMVLEAPPVQVPLPTGRETWPESLRSAFDDMERAVAGGNVEQMQAAATHLDGECRRAHLRPAEIAGALQRAFHDDPRLVARGITDEIMVKLAEDGQMEFCHVVVSAWNHAEARDRLAAYGSALLKRCALLSSSEGALLMARVGLLIALDDPSNAILLANAAFPHLPLESREQLIGQIEHGAALGQLFSTLPPRLRPFWLRQLRPDAPKQDWATPEARQAIGYLVQCRGARWNGWGVVRGLMTPEAWTPVESQLQEQIKRVEKARAGDGFATGYARPQYFVGPTIFILIAIIRFIASFSGSGDRSSPDISHLLQEANQTQTRYEVQALRERRPVNPAVPQTTPNFAKIAPFLPSPSNPSVKSASTMDADRRVLDNLTFGSALAAPSVISPAQNAVPAPGMKGIVPVGPKGGTASGEQPSAAPSPSSSPLSPPPPSSKH